MMTISAAAAAAAAVVPLRRGAIVSAVPLVVRTFVGVCSAVYSFDRIFMCCVLCSI